MSYGSWTWVTSWSLHALAVKPIRHRGRLSRPHGPALHARSAMRSGEVIAPTVHDKARGVMPWSSRTLANVRGPSQAAVVRAWRAPATRRRADGRGEACAPRVRGRNRHRSSVIRFATRIFLRRV